MHKKMQVNVLCIWQPSDQLKKYLTERLSHLPQVNLIFPEDTKEETLLRLAPEADIIMGWRPSRKLLEKAKRMKLFINPGAGVQHLTSLFQDLNKKRNVILVNGHGNSYFTAQHAVALLLSLTNKIILHHNWMVDGLWRRGDDYAPSIPLRNRTIGLLGYGAVNTKVHKFLSGFDVNFAILRRDWSKQKDPLPTPADKYSFDNLHSFLSHIDILIVAVAMTEKTKGLIGAKELELLGPEGLVVNMARGAVIEEESLYKALKKKKIAGAAIDVWYNYSPTPNVDGFRFPSKFPFYTLENVV
ncbi:MAG: NAD(P)-dependent oxidoreductase, partial [Candidatus Heimdallarchaeaceae archaeon]